MKLFVISALLTVLVSGYYNSYPWIETDIARLEYNREELSQLNFYILNSVANLNSLSKVISRLFANY